MHIIKIDTLKDSIIKFLNNNLKVYLNTPFMKTSLVHTHPNTSKINPFIRLFVKTKQEIVFFVIEELQS